MNLPAGSRIGPYEILASIGAGGMGEVYRARDARLDRDVAIKVLPESFAADPDRLMRFTREAKTLASLNHPNIAAIYGLEQVPEATGNIQPGRISALVMELVEGEDLSVRIARGAMALDEALPIARQLADALEAAHAQGIVHRDLKPANIKVRADGTVKVLDFGLAKAMDTAGRDFSPGARDFTPGAVDSPTMTSPALTAMGLIIGTAAYMAPEQARGRVIDRRADVWAFGVVVYEMLTGRRAFEGDEITDVLAAVLKDPIALDRLPPATPASVRRLLRRCLEKDRAKRLDSMAVARLEIDDAAGADDGLAHAAAARRMPPARVAGVAVAAAVAAALLGGAAVWRAMQPPAPPVLRLTITPAPGRLMQVETNHHDVALTRAGDRVLYWDRADAGYNRLAIRGLGDYEVAVIDGGPNARGMSASPDGAWIVYQGGAPGGGNSVLLKIPAAGGTPVRITPFVGNLRGASWGTDGRIVFASSRTGQGLMRVAATGGTLETLTVPDAAAGEIDHLWPQLLPGNTHALFVVRRTGGQSDIALADLEGRTWRLLGASGTMPRYAASGHLVYSAGGVLKASRFDAASGATSGDPVVMLDDVLTKDSGAANYDIAENGTLVYMQGSGTASNLTLAWVDRGGVRTPLDVTPRQYRQLRVSPDGRQVAVTIEEDGVQSAWVVDLARQTLSRLASTGLNVIALEWSPDSRHVALGSAAGPDGQPGGIFIAAASGTGAARRVTSAPPAVFHRPTDWSHGGILFVESEGLRVDVMRVDVESSRVEAVLNGPADEGGAALSRDGRWLAYVSGETGRMEVYVRPYPDVAADRITVTSSGSGGRAPFWTDDDRELLFVSTTGSVMAVPVDRTGGGSLSLKPPVLIADHASTTRTQYLGFARDGARVLTAARPDSAANVNEYRVILNWFEELKARVKLP